MAQSRAAPNVPDDLEERVAALGIAVSELQSACATRVAELVASHHARCAALAGEIAELRARRMVRLAITSRAAVSAASPAVDFYVGGQRFSVSAITLAQHPDSLLAQLAAQTTPTHYDRSARLFELLLEWLRDGVLEVEALPPLTRQGLYREARFFQLSQLANELAPFVPGGADGGADAAAAATGATVATVATGATVATVATVVGVVATKSAPRKPKKHKLGSGKRPHNQGEPEAPAAADAPPPRPRKVPPPKKTSLAAPAKKQRSEAESATEPQQGDAASPSRASKRPGSVAQPPPPPLNSPPLEGDPPASEPPTSSPGLAPVRPPGVVHKVIRLPLKQEPGVEDAPDVATCPTCGFTGNAKGVRIHRGKAHH